MKWNGCGGLFALISMSVFTTSVLAQDLTIVVNRHADWTELYLSASAPNLFETFDIQPSKFAGHDDQVDFASFQSGTAWLGDHLLDKSEISIGADVGGFEAMSFMVHPVAEKLSMTSPFEGMIAIGVCNGPRAGTMIDVNDLHAYVGYFSEKGSQGQPIEIDLPKGASASFKVQVHEFNETGEVRQYETTISSKGTLTLDAQRLNDRPWRSAFLSALLKLTGAQFLK